MNKLFLSTLTAFLMVVGACSCSPEGNGPSGSETSLGERNLTRAITMVDAAVPGYFDGPGMKMSRYYNPFTNTRADNGSVWMYTSAIEAVNGILHGLEAHKEKGNSSLYDKHYERYIKLLNSLYEGLEFYAGTFTLTSFTQTKEWTVYAVDRANGKGGADVTGILNVYDDQEWLVRELLDAYKITGEQKFLNKAEYLAEYVLDGWDCTLDNNGNEYGGIPWGPGYCSMHACSNGPFISPLVWLHELYKDKPDQVTYGYVGANKERLKKTVKKSDYYLEFAKKVYAWQKQHLLRSDGVYHDMKGADNNIPYETVGGVEYRAHRALGGAGGEAHSYNSGSPLSGLVDLYRVTNDARYLTDLKTLSDKSFNYFAKPNSKIEGCYDYKYNGFANWFNGVLLRSWIEAYPLHDKTAVYIDSFQKNLDYATKNFVRNGFLPANLLVGWSPTDSNNKMEGLSTFGFAANYAVLALYEFGKE